MNNLGLMMYTKNFDDFASAARAAGFDEVLERYWAPDTKLDVQSHNFAAQAVVTQGEMWLTCDGVTRHLTCGDTFSIGHQVPHSERYGAQGATYWVARRLDKTH